ncbi:hypothetical protein [Burkholderia sp. Ax-1719]|uniref:DUF7079 family protein n=1 Tax=Burkholderia sp. Ax-1719 TaxID=2608334 RepID=UPI001422D92A|nr:hypothetical protein [Burkholderia sp. Ax-1719]NIE65907.1 hypothetical protein [Burkholderia sp. Ax-1719]
MADTVSQEMRRECWCTLALMFVDNVVDYHYVAEQLVRHCSSMSMSMLKEVLFNEVAPALSGAVMTPAPEVWLMWDPDEVVALVSRMLARRNASFFYRVGNNISRWQCRSLAQDFWRALEPELLAVQRVGLGS